MYIAKREIDMLDCSWTTLMNWCLVRSCYRLNRLYL